MKQKKKKSSLLAILIAIVLAMIIGTWTGKESALFGITFYSIFDLVGKIFINALTLIVVPLVSTSIITGIARIAGESSFGRLGLKTFGFYLCTSFLAILIGIFLVNLIEPGHSITARPMVEASQLASIGEKLDESGLHRIAKLFLDIVPSNIVEAFSKGNMLGLIFFSLLFGYALSRIEENHSSIVIGFCQGLFQATLYMTHLIMRFLPIGVFFLVAKVFAETGLESLQSVYYFFITVLIGLALFLFVALPLVLKFVGGVSPINHFRAMAPALITAFSTSSSAASLPITLDCVEKRAGVSNRICSLVIPLGTSINLSGSALYEAVAALFVAQAYGLHLSFWTQVVFTFVTLLTSIGVAGVPSGSLVAIIVILKAMGLPIDGIALFIAADRILDMCRTTVNVFSDSCCAVLVARSEGEKGILTKRVFEEE
ncbi:MAG TPA: dicarboxylate/amino acid:cation symporter [Rhabdochlamydiaceae bacterium]|nr:dicarboxylate/amino acid:cation symporter [Rhabdochlamydiaceae bacterium]